MIHRGATPWTFCLFPSNTAVLCKTLWATQLGILKAKILDFGNFQWWLLETFVNAWKYPTESIFALFAQTASCPLREATKPTLARKQYILKTSNRAKTGNNHCLECFWILKFLDWIDLLKSGYINIFTFTRAKNSYRGTGLNCWKVRFVGVSREIQTLPLESSQDQS